MFNLGLQAEKIYRKPYIPMLYEDNARRGFFEHGEFIALLNALSDYFKPVATFAYCLAMQISGHKTRSGFDRYNIVTEEDLKETARRSSLYTKNLEKATKVVVLKQN